MKNNRFTKKRIRMTACLTAISIILSQSAVSMAKEEAPDIKYIDDIEELPEQDANLAYEEKPSSEDLQDVFPDTLTVVLDGEKKTTEIEVDWECEIDYESEWPEEGEELYTFVPKWDESSYMLTDMEGKTVKIPVITVSIGEAEENPSRIEDLETAQEDLQGITRQKSILALVYLCDKYEVKDSPSKDGTAVVSVVSGQSVQIAGVDLDEDGNVWYKVSFYDNDKDYAGYIEKQYLATSDEDFLGWTDEYVEEEEISPNRPKTMSIMTVSGYPDVNQFPASYQNSLLALKQQYPNWIFVKMETGLDFNTAVANEMKNDRSWISSSKPASWQNGSAKQSGWSLASEGILRYYMDPRNFLNESAIFQFEQLTYNESYHTESAVQAIIAGSFMSGDIPDENMTYAKAFTEIGKELKISPFHLASRVLQEQGTNGTSPLISGKYSGFEGYYNYFNVGASGGNVELIVKGLTEAKNRGWNTRYKSLYGGASVIGQNYIKRGQDTLYLQKFNVTSNSTYDHQYMQNIMAPATEAPGIKKAYSDTGSLNNSFVFKIPVYGGMPASACSQPDTTDTITLNKSTVSDLAVDKTEKLIPYVNGSKVDSVNDMTFTSSNTEVATVNAQGLIKAISPGTATVTCARSGAKSASCTVKVVKAEPIVDTPVLSPAVYKDGLKLSDIDLPEGWSWSSPGTLLEAGTDSYPAVYTPADTTKYLTVTKQVGLKVSQAIPSCTVPEKLTAKIGSILGSIELPTGFSWESDAETILDKAGEKTYYLSYDPNDKNYLILNHIPVVVKIIGDNVEPEDPDDWDGQLPGGDSGNGGGNGTGGSGNGGGTGSSGSGTGTGTGTGTGSTSSGSTNSGSTSTGSTNSGSTNSGSTSTGSTSSGSASTGTDNPGTDSPGSSTNNGNTSTGSTSSGSTSTGTTSSGSTSTGTTSSGSTSTGTTSSGSTSTGSTSSSTSTSSTGTTSSGSTNSNVNSVGASDKSNKTSGSEGASSDSSDRNRDDGITVDDVNSDQTGNSSADSSNSSQPDNSVSGGAGNNKTDNAAAVTNGSNTKGNNTNSTGTAQSGASNNTAAPGNHSTLLEDSNHKAEDNGKEAESGEEPEEPVYDRPAVTMDMEDVPILTAEMLQMAKDQNVDLLLMMNDRAVWHVNAGNIQGNISDIDMSVLFERNDIPEDLLAAWVQENEYLEFTLAHDGPFGFAAELEIMLNPEDSGRYANLFYFDLKENTLDYICTCVIDENGRAVFPMEHASGYVIIISDYPMTSVPEMNEEPDSGSASGWVILGIVILVLLAVSGTAGYFYLRKRREEEYYDDEDDEDDEDETDEDEDAIGNNDIADIEDYEVSMKDAIEDLSAVEDSKQSDGLMRNGIPITDLSESEEADMTVESAEDDWIEDEDWQEPEESEAKNPYADDHAEDDWIEDDEWDISNDWMDDDEWEKKSNAKKTAV